MLYCGHGRKRNPVAKWGSLRCFLYVSLCYFYLTNLTITSTRSATLFSGLPFKLNSDHFDWSGFSSFLRLSLFPFFTLLVAVGRLPKQKRLDTFVKPFREYLGLPSACLSSTLLTFVLLTRWLALRPLILIPLMVISLAFFGEL